VLPPSDLFLSDESGQGLVEYALLLALVSLTLLAALSLMTSGIGKIFQAAADPLSAGQ
jgi:Flp pilus assembly pilin Flp